jgi:hypothetical protein
MKSETRVERIIRDHEFFKRTPEDTAHRIIEALRKAYYRRPEYEAYKKAYKKAYQQREKNEAK